MYVQMQDEKDSLHRDYVKVIHPKIQDVRKKMKEYDAIDKDTRGTSLYG